MAKLNLSIAVRDYDRTRPLTDGTVQIDGVDPVFLALDPEEIFFRAFRHAEFDICELSLSSSTVKTAQGDFAYVGVPAFVSRAFRHTSIYVRTDRVKQPADLKGRKVGISEYQLTANVWARALLEDEYGVKPTDIHWIRGGLEQAGRVEKITITLPANIRLDPAPEGATLNAMLEAGEIDAFIGPRTPSCFEQGRPNIGWLWSEPMAAAKDSFRKTGNFPIMHMIGVRRALVEQHPWLPAAVLKAFTRAKSICLALLEETSASKVTLPFMEEQVKAARDFMGADFWPYGIPANRKTLEYFLAQHHRQGLSPRLVKVEELFHPTTFETYKV
ncbi:MAG: ABC transporter substrate-binding protein [Alphaproteobacteria bacterium]|nr:MAG: ABC transporter substrate-binding protein [Alphaproteobacteria bacterium]